MFDPTIWMGVELEVEIKNDPDALQQYTSKHRIYGSYPKHQNLGFVHHKHGAIAKVVDELSEDKITSHHDNTVNDGFEWIGASMNMKENKRLWSQLLLHPKVAPYIHGDDVKVTQGQYGIHDCGMHVHVSGDPVTPLILGKEFMFINNKANKPFIEYIAGRELNSFCQTQPLQKINAVTSLYHSANCTKKNQRGRRIKHNAHGGADVVVINSETLKSDYCCANGRKAISQPFVRGAMWVIPAFNTGDYEIRLFKSTVKVDRFYANLEFVVASIDFCHQVSMKDLTYKEFGKWISSLGNRIRYPYLFKFMRAEGYTTGVLPKSETLRAMMAKGKMSEPIRAMRIVE